MTTNIHPQRKKRKYLQVKLGVYEIYLKKIKENFLSGSERIKEIIFTEPDVVIGEHAFSNMRDLTTVVFENGGPAKVAKTAFTLSFPRFLVVDGHTYEINTPTPPSDTFLALASLYGWDTSEE